MRLAVIFTISLVSLVGCGKREGEQKPAADKAFDINGTVVEVDAAKKKVTLDHEDIPGLMKGMKMPFDVDNAQILEGVKAGDKVHGKLKVQGGKYIILELHKR